MWICQFIFNFPKKIKRTSYLIGRIAKIIENVITFCTSKSLFFFLHSYLIGIITISGDFPRIQSVLPRSDIKIASQRAHIFRRTRGHPAGRPSMENFVMAKACACSCDRDASHRQRWSRSPLIRAITFPRRQPPIAAAVRRLFEPGSYDDDGGDDRRARRGPVESRTGPVEKSRWPGMPGSQGARSERGRRCTAIAH